MTQTSQASARDARIATEFEDESTFWYEVEDTLAQDATTKPRIRHLVQQYVTLVVNHGQAFLKDDRDVQSCCYRLLNCANFARFPSEFRDILSEWRPGTHGIAHDFLHLSLLILDGRRHSKTFKLMKRAGLARAIAELGKNVCKESPRLMRLTLTALYEMCRIQKLQDQDLEYVDEEYIWFLLRGIELADDDADPYAYSQIRVIISLNEQFMVASLPQAHQPFPKSPSGTSLHIPESSSEEVVTRTYPNSIIKVLSSHNSRFKAFGENLIRMLNRERDSAIQLLILKQLFLLFTNPATYEYFYTNDLYVLVDVFIRELYDLPTNDEALRHTYLRVLHPLLIHTQLRNPPYYKTVEIVNLLQSLNQECDHFGPVGATTVRLLARCLTVPWLLPPKKRRLKLPRPSFADRSKTDKEAVLGISLDTTDYASKLSVHSVESVNSIAKVRPPTSPRVKAGSLRQREKLKALPEARARAPAPPTPADTNTGPSTTAAQIKEAHLTHEMQKLQVIA